MTRLASLVPLLAGLALGLPEGAQAQTPPPPPANDIRIVEDASGIRLLVDGDPFMVKGVNWDYFPIGTTTTYNFWGEPDAFIREALDREMGLLKAMGGNTIRTYVGIPPRWVEYIHDTYGIWTIVNHPVGRYGVTMGGRYFPATDYSDPQVRDLLRSEVQALAREFAGTRGLLMWLLGNENNYGLEWSSAETENLPEGERFQVMARYLYSLMGEVVDAVKAIDPHTPVAMANGDLQYLDIIAEEVANLDVFGSNVYRGITFTDLFERVDATMGIPVLYTEFGPYALPAPGSFSSRPEGPGHHPPPRYWPSLSPPNGTAAEDPKPLNRHARPAFPVVGGQGRGQNARRRGLV